MTATSIDRWLKFLTSASLGAAYGCGAVPAAEKPVSAFRAEPIASAAYAAFVVELGRDRAAVPGIEVLFERGAYVCREIVARQRDAPNYPDREEPTPEGPNPTCPQELQLALQSAGHRSLVIMDGTGTKTVPAAEVPHWLAPIDSSEKAALVAWVSGHELSWKTGKGYEGSVEQAHVHLAEDGFDVVTGKSVGSGGCGSGGPTETVTDSWVRVRVRRDGSAFVVEEGKIGSREEELDCHVHGRRPEGFEDVTAGSTACGYFRRTMHHEAESVRAFSRLARELRAHGAPPALVRAATAAARDERRHAVTFARLLSRCGERTRPRFERDDLPVRALRDVAVENAREGCVLETYAAAVAVHQSMYAAGSDVRAVYRDVASDELRHAALARAVNEWAVRGLTARDRRAVARATARTEARLASSFGPLTPMRRWLGLPDPAAARRLFAHVVAPKNIAA